MSDKSKLAAENRLKTTRWWIIAALVIGFCSIVLLLQRRQKQERNQLLQQHLTSSEALVQAQQRLANYVQEVQQQSQEASLAETAMQEQAGNEEAHVRLQRLNASLLHTDESWNEFRNLYQQVYPGFFSELQQRYPDLSPAETRVLSLCKLQLSSKEMALMQGISQESLRKARYRLRKKYPALLQDDDFRNTI